MSLSNDHFSNDYWISGEDHNGWEDGGEVDQEKDPVITAMVATTETHVARQFLSFSFVFRIHSLIDDLTDCLMHEGEQ